MKKINMLIATLISLFVIITSQPAYSTPIVRLDGGPVVAVGETFAIDVFIDGVIDIDPFWGSDQVLAFGFDIVSDPSFIYNGATVGASFMDDSAVLPTTDVAGSAFPGVAGNNIALASLSFTAIASGNFDLGILSNMLDPNQGLHTWLSMTPLNLSSTMTVTVPAPNSVLVSMLAGIGLVGIGLVRNPNRYEAKQSG